MIREAARGIKEWLDLGKVIVTLLVLIFGGVWWQAFETATTRSEIKKLIEEQVEAREDRDYLGERIQSHEYQLRDHDYRLKNLENFRKDD